MSNTTTVITFFDLCQHLFKINNDVLSEEVPKLWPEDSWVRTLAYAIYYIIGSVFGYVIIRLIGECFFVWTKSRKVQQQKDKKPTKSAAKYSRPKQQRIVNYSSSSEGASDESSSD